MPGNRVNVKLHINKHLIKRQRTKHQLNNYYYCLITLNIEVVKSTQIISRELSRSTCTSTKGLHNFITVVQEQKNFLITTNVKFYELFNFSHSLFYTSYLYDLNWCSYRVLISFFCHFFLDYIILTYTFLYRNHNITHKNNY